MDDSTKIDKMVAKLRSGVVTRQEFEWEVLLILQGRR